MIRIEADENDLRRLAKISGGLSDQLTNLRITEDGQIAFEVIQDGVLTPDVSVKVDIAKASDTSLEVGFALEAANPWVPDFLVSWGNGIASIFDCDLASTLAGKCSGMICRESASRISFHLPALCEKLNIPLAVSIADVSLEGELLALELKLE